MAGLIAESFDKTSSEHANRIAVYGLSEGVTRTFGELRGDVAVLRQALVNLGLPARPTIVSNVGNRTGFIPLFMATLDLGGSLLPMDGDAPAREVLKLADTYGADLIVVPAGATALRRLAAAPLPCGLACLVRRPAEGPSWRRPNDTGAFVLKVTSGSTGVAKVVMASEDNLLSDGEHVIEAMDISASDINLGTVPMAHSYGMGNLLLPLLLAGAPLVLRDRFVYAQWVNDVTKFGVTAFPAVPFIFDYVRRVDDAADLAGIRLLVTAGAPIDFETLSYFKNRFGIKIHSLYGTSETGSITFDSSDTLSYPVSVGWPVSGTTVTLTPSHGSSVSRIRVQGSAVCRRYAFVDAENDGSAEFTPEGFLTADIGTFEEDGRLRLLGRVSDFVNIAGRKVHPSEVERVIAEMHDVVHVCVLGVASDSRGQELVACVHRRNLNLSAAAVRTHCAETLSPYKIPRRVVFADELPVSARGKTERRAIEALLKTSGGQADAL